MGGDAVSARTSFWLLASACALFVAAYCSQQPTPAPPNTPTPTARVVVVPASPTVHQSPTPSPWVPFDFLPVQTPRPTATVTPTATPTTAPTVAPTADRPPLQRG